MAASPPKWHTLVCCDHDHGSSSLAAGSADVVMADMAETNTTASSDSSGPAGSVSTAPTSLALSLQKASLSEVKCPSPCPFETYCCLDEHCAADCLKSKQANEQAQCADENCAVGSSDACFDPNCDDGCEAECCDDPECEPEWCVEGCTIEEYLECCASVCNEPEGIPLGLLPSTSTATGSTGMVGPPYFDLISAALAGQLAAAAPQPAPYVAPPMAPAAPPPGPNVCHWQNCHRTFESMPQLLAHLAADHLGAGAFDQGTSAAPSSAQPTPSGGQHTPASHSMSVVQTPQSPMLPYSFDGGVLGNNAPQMGSTSTAAANAANGDLFSCLWDDCFPLDGLNVGMEQNNQASSLQTQHGQGHNHAHPHPHAHSHSHSHPETGAPLSPQTMLRHLLEEHLGVVPALIDPNAISQQVTHDHNQGSGHEGHGHEHPGHPGHATHDHVHVHDGHEHTHPHGHAHAHPHSHNPRPKPYSRPVSMARNTIPAVKNVPHPHPHAHSHDHDHHPVHGHHHHVKFPPSPSPTPSGENAALICLWPGCTHCEPFATTGDLMEHLSEEHVGRGRDKYRCLWDGCGGPEGRLFRSRQKVLRHLQSHTGHRPFICHVCGQSFSEAAPLAAHLRRHSDDKPYVCDFPGCGKAFAISSSLTIHKRTHNGDKPFVCSYCGKGFVEASNLTKHVRTHTGERPFACNHPGCGRAFSRPDQLKRHMLVHEAGRQRKTKDTVKKEAVLAAA